MLRGMVEMMKNAAKFLSWPIVQYIPIRMQNIGKSDAWTNPFSQPSPLFYLFQDPDALKGTLARFDVHSAALPPAGDLYVLCLNFQTDLVLFRHLTCKFIGSTRIGSYHAYAVTKKYFPRRSIHFVMYEHDGRKLRSVNEEIY